MLFCSLTPSARGFKLNKDTRLGENGVEKKCEKTSDTFISRGKQSLERAVGFAAHQKKNKKQTPASWFFSSWRLLGISQQVTEKWLEKKGLRERGGRDGRTRVDALSGSFGSALGHSTHSFIEIPLCDPALKWEIRISPSSTHVRETLNWHLLPCFFFHRCLFLQMHWLVSSPLMTLKHGSNRGEHLCLSPSSH